jgi:predicted membrane channel-forming protein YqfA (hemolysin III family)
MARRDTVFHLIGWLLFLVCAVLFLVSGVNTGDGLLIAGSVVFLVACIVFLVPLIGELRRARQ